MEQRIFKSFQELYRSEVSPGNNDHIQFTPEILAYIGSVAFSFNDDHMHTDRPAERQIRNLALLSSTYDLKRTWCCLDPDYLKADGHRFPFYSGKYAKNIGLMLLSRTESRNTKYKPLSPGTVVFPTFIDPNACFIQELSYPNTEASLGIVLDRQESRVLVLWDRYNKAISCEERDLIEVNFCFTQEELDGIWTTFQDCDVWQSKVRPLCHQLSLVAEYNKKLFGKEKPKKKTPETITQLPTIPKNNELQNTNPVPGLRKQEGETRRQPLQKARTEDGGGYTSDARKNRRPHGGIERSQVSGHCHAPEYRRVRSRTVEGYTDSEGEAVRIPAGPGEPDRGISHSVSGRENCSGTAGDQTINYHAPSDAVSDEVFECTLCGESSMYCIQHHTGHTSGVYECVNEECGHKEYFP